MPHAKRMRGKAKYERASHQMVNSRNENAMRKSRNLLCITMAAKPTKCGLQGML